MNKLLKLYSNLKKNNTTFGMDEDGQSSNTGKTIAIVLGIIISLLLGYVGYQYAGIIELIGGNAILLKAFGIMAMGVILVWGIKDLVNSMYTSSDIEILITMPFTSVQIAILRVLSFLKTAFLVTCVLVLPINIGFALGTSINVGAFTLILCSCVLIPIFSIAIIASILIIVMSFIKLLRNQDILKYLGVAVAFLALIAFYSITSNDKGIDVNFIITKTGEISNTITYINPVSGFIAKAIETSNILWAVLSLAITAVSVGIFYIIAQLLYLRGALNIQSTSKSFKILTDDELKKACRKKSIRQAILAKEYKMVRRNPVYLFNNFLIGFLWPILAIVLFKGSAASLQGIVSDYNGEIGTIVTYSSIFTILFLFIGGLFLLNENIAYSSITREGKSFFIMKQIPVSYEEQIMAKKELARRFGQITITAYFFIFSIIFSIALKIPFFVFIVPVIIMYLYVELMITLEMYYGLKNTNINWDNEKDATKKSSAVYTIIYIVCLILFVAIGTGCIALATIGEQLIAIAICIMIAFIVSLYIANRILNKKMLDYGCIKMRKIK